MNNNYIPSLSNQNTEDTVDIIICDYFTNTGWKVAFYSSPCGSWSTINFNINEELYQTFTPRDLKRPDIIFYKINNNKITILLIESKDLINKFNPNNVIQYTQNMNHFIKKLITEKFRFKKLANGTILENIKLPKEFTFNVLLGFACNSENWILDTPRFENLISIGQIGILVKTDWSKITSKIKIISKNKDVPELEKELFY